MSSADGAQSTPQNICPSENSSCIGETSDKASSEVEVVKNSGLYRFVKVQTCPNHNGSNEVSPRPSLQSTAEMYSRSLNDVSSLMNQSTVKEDDSQSEILHLRKRRQPQSQPLTPPSLRHRLLKKIRPKRPWEASHDHGQDCSASLAASLGPAGQLRRRDRDLTQIHTSSDDEDAESRSVTARERESLEQRDQTPLLEPSGAASGA